MAKRAGPWEVPTQTLILGTVASQTANTALAALSLAPLSPSFSFIAFKDFFISFVFLAALMVWYQFLPDWRIITLPFFLILASLASFGFGLWIAALNVKYRDFRYIVPFFIQFFCYILNFLIDQWICRIGF